MSREDLEDLDEVASSKKNKMSVDQFIQQFQTLDASNYGGWPISVKVTVWFFILFAVIALGYFTVVRNIMGKVDASHAQQTNLLNEFRDKDSKLRNLKQYEAQLKTIEANFSQQLEQLPKESEIPSLVEDINMTGVNSGLRFSKINLADEVKQEFFIEQPIDIEATGDYHAFGAFASAIAALPRIVTLHNFRIIAKQDKVDDVPVVSYTVQAKTYRYAGDQANQKDDTSANATITEGGQP